MGIDIRDGQQLECITCALCIDACDDVMDKLGKERGLISYATLNDYNANMALATGSGTGDRAGPGARPARRQACRRDQAHRLALDHPAAHLRLLRRLVGDRARHADGAGAAARPLSSQRAARPQPALRRRCRDGSIRNGYDGQAAQHDPRAARRWCSTLDGLPGSSLSEVEGSRHGAAPHPVAASPTRCCRCASMSASTPRRCPRARPASTSWSRTGQAGIVRAVESTFDAPEKKP